MKAGLPYLKPSNSFLCKDKLTKSLFGNTCIVIAILRDVLGREGASPKEIIDKKFLLIRLPITGCLWLTSLIFVFHFWDHLCDLTSLLKDHAIRKSHGPIYVVKSVYITLSQVH